MKINSKLIIYPLVVISLLFASGRSLALFPINPDLLKPKMPIIKIDPWTLRCSKIEESVQKKIANFDESKVKHIEIYTRLSDRLSERITKWKEMGYDVSDLEANKKTLNEKISKYKTDYATFIQKLKDTQQYDCGHSEGEFVSALNKAKTELKVVRQDASEIREYYQTEIRPNILELKKQNLEENE